VPILAGDPSVLPRNRRSTATDHTELPGYVRFDARLGFRSGRIESTLFLENVFDRRYIRSGTERLGVLYGSPRSVLVSTRVFFEGRRR
jgi:iron complex outermembrane receptor protein